MGGYIKISITLRPIHLEKKIVGEVDPEIPQKKEKVRTKGR